jgi:hypothetical protein
MIASRYYNGVTLLQNKDDKKILLKKSPLLQIRIYLPNKERTEGEQTWQIFN